MLLHHIGFFPKDVRVPDLWNGPPHITDICSVSEHVNSEPPDWIQRWLHNDLGFFNTIELARAVLPPDAERFAVFAYRLLPQVFRRGTVEAFAVPSFPVAPIPDAYVSLGFDIASRTMDSFFSCSPL